LDPHGAWNKAPDGHPRNKDARRRRVREGELPSDSKTVHIESPT
jgi:hypothetical protein